MEKILLFILSLSFLSLYSSHKANQTVERMHLLYEKNENLLLKAQMKAIIHASEFSTDGSGEYFDRQGISKALRFMLFPFREGFVDDWVIENASERLEEQLNADDLNLMNYDAFVEYMVKINPQNYLGYALWNKLKDRTIYDEHARDDLRVKPKSEEESEQPEGKEDTERKEEKTDM